MDAIPPTLPFIVARTYGAHTDSRAASARDTSRRDAREIAGQPVDRVDVSFQPAPRPAAHPLRDRVDQSLIAAQVPGRVYFESAPIPNSGAYQMYARPTDKNSAATAVNVGRVIDVEG